MNTDQTPTAQPSAGAFAVVRLLQPHLCTGLSEDMAELYSNAAAVDRETHAKELVRLAHASLDLFKRIPLFAVEANTGIDILQARWELSALLAKIKGGEA